MKSAVQDHYGSPEVLEIRETAPVTPARGEVLVRVHAAPVTQGDRRLRAADFPGASAIIGRLMFGVFRPRNGTPGTNFAGRVVAVGEDVTKFAVGDDVFGSCDHGAYAEFVAVPEDGRVVRIPAGVDYDAAAASPYGAGTALTFLRDLAKVQPGERVLIVGASGGAGRYAVQVARHLGAEVTGVCSQRHAAMVKELGASEVIAHELEDYAKRGEIYDVVFDTTTGDDFERARACLSERGRYVTLYMSGKALRQMLWTSVFGGPRVTTGVALGTQALLEDVAALLADGSITPRVVARVPFARIVEAHQQLERGNPGGDVIVAIDEVSKTISQGPTLAAA